MCAIFGIIGEYDEAKARESLKKLTHRGPDFCSIKESSNLFFAHQHLRIMDANNSSKQILNDKNILVSFNGEIYNYKELTKELSASGFIFKTNTEIEMIMFAYKKWGVDFVTRLRGMFAIAIMDGDTLYLFRDRLGKKPIFYLDGKSFVFASELKAITPFLKNIEMDKGALLSYLSYLAPTPPYTFFKGIKKLGMGEYLVYKNSRLEVKKYFDLLDAQPNLITDKDEALQILEAKIEESINIRLKADVPMASLLSGGIDSASINFYAKKNGLNLQTYTLGYKDYEKYDERIDAKKTASHLGLQNTQVEISIDDYARASEAVFESLDEPLNDPASIPLYLLFEKIKKDGYKVVMSGEGADELFLGYRHYFNYLDVESMKSMPNKNWLKSYFRSNYNQNREWEWYKRALEDSTVFRTSGEKFTDLQKNNLMKQNIKDNQALIYLQKYRDTFENSQHTDEATWYSYIDLHLFQAEHFLTKLDRVSMAHSIESRTPFLDHKLSSLVFSLDPKLRYGDRETKSLLKQIMKPYLGSEIISRKKKGFSNPYMEFLLESRKIELIKDVNNETGLFKTKVLDELISGANSGAFKHHIWGLYVLSIWIKKWLL